MAVLWKNFLLNVELQRSFYVNREASTLLFPLTLLIYVFISLPKYQTIADVIR